MDKKKNKEYMTDRVMKKLNVEIEIAEKLIFLAHERSIEKKISLAEELQYLRQEDITKV